MTKLVSHSELLDRFVGEKDSPKREQFEAELSVDILAAKIKEMRLKLNMTQSELAELVGKDKTQISKIESGRNLTISTIVQLIKAMGGKINFDIQFTS